MDADGETARAGVEVVPGERPLTSPVEAAVRVQRERMRGNDGAGAEHGEDVLRDLAPVHVYPSSGAAAAQISAGSPKPLSCSSAIRANGRSFSNPRLESSFVTSV